MFVDEFYSEIVDNKQGTTELLRTKVELSKIRELVYIARIRKANTMFFLKVMQDILF